MVRMKSHADACELLGAYALDAVDPDEAEAIEAHVETCPRCRHELRSHREVVGVLAYAGQEAPEGLWDRVAARIHDSSEIAGPIPVLRALGPGGAAWPGARRGAPKRRSRLVGVLSFAAAAAMVAVALLGVQVGHLQERTNHLSGQLAAMSGQPTMADVTAALATPGAREVVLKPPDGGSALLAAVILPSGQGYLFNPRLSPLPSSRTYQLWGVIGTDVVSYGVLGPAPQGVMPFRVSAGVAALAVTNEVAGGVVSSTQPPVAVGSVT
jgi:anti-sigma factor RsiW